MRTSFSRIAMTQLPPIFSNVCSILAITPLLLSASTVTGSIELAPASGHAQTHQENRSDVVIWLQPVHSPATRPAPAEHVQLVQKDKMFRPHVLPISVGSVVDFPNVDPIFHNAFSSFDGQLFDVGLYPPGTSRSVHFYRAGIVRVFCNIHPSMSAVILVLDTPFFSRANREGDYEISGVPPGTYEVHVFDERATAPNSAILLNVDEGKVETTIPPIHISEAGYVRPPHKNKFGMDYPPSSSELESYPGPPK